MNKNSKNTYSVSDTIFREVYDSPGRFAGPLQVANRRKRRPPNRGVAGYAAENHRRAALGQR